MITSGAPVAIHQPVLLEEVLAALAPVSGGLYVDANLGLGGHAERILQASAPDGRLIGFEWDDEAMARAKTRLAPFGQRVTFVPKNFTTLPQTLDECGVSQIDGLLCDLGISSLQLDLGSRGFSFKGSQPLDMRMNQGSGPTAADLLASASEEELADIFYYFGEERQARRLAACLVEHRERCPLVTTDQLVALVEGAIPKRFHPKKIHVATKVFQALRIAVNHELDNLMALLACAPELLAEGATCAIISFHSLEDRLVKRAFAGAEALQIITKRPIVASEPELLINPRARSAKLRVARKQEKR